MISKEEALISGSFGQAIQAMEIKIDEKIKEWRGERIIIDIGDPELTNAAVDVLIQRYQKGGWRVTYTTIATIRDHECHDVPVLILE